MNPSAQNAMLKLLEEGPPYACFLLLAANAGGILQTVRSRCEELTLTIQAGLEEACSEEGWQLVKKLAGALEGADELTLFEVLMELGGKWGRGELSALLGALETELGARAVRGGDRKRLMKAAELIKQLRGAAQLNVNVGQLAGWLCAGMYENP